MSGLLCCVVGCVCDFVVNAGIIIIVPVLSFGFLYDSMSNGWIELFKIRQTWFLKNRFHFEVLKMANLGLHFMSSRYGMFDLFSGSILLFERNKSVRRCKPLLYMYTPLSIIRTTNLKTSSVKHLVVFFLF